MCTAYPFLLDHFRLEIRDPENDKDKQAKAQDLYSRLCAYDTLLLIHFYRDITFRMAITSQQLQTEGLRMSQVGKHITSLLASLRKHYSLEKKVPDNMFGDGHTDNLIRDLFNIPSNESVESISFTVVIC
jgi:hypothetical protein